MQFEEEIVISTTADKLFSLYADVSGWSSWDPGVRSSSVDGQFSSGATGTLRPASGPEAKITFTEVVPGRSFTVESRLPLCVMRFEHELAPAGSQLRVVHRVSFAGILAPLFGRLIGSGIRKNLPHTLAGLRRVAEQAG